MATIYAKQAKFFRSAYQTGKHGWPEADRAVDRARFRFGPDAIRPASLIG